MTVAAVVGLAASAGVSAQDKPAFTATGQTCDEITWSAETLARYPSIASACQGVVVRNGTTYVKFEGTVRRVADRGQSLTVAFKDGERLTLTPPPETTFYINGKATPPRSLRPGDELRFYVPETRLVASVFEETDTAPPVEVPMSPPPAEEEETVAMAPAEPLPKTAGPLPLLGIAGLGFLGLGALLRIRRRA
jgi:hypothetical protein